MQDAISGRPPGMAGVPEMQDAISGRPPGIAGVPPPQPEMSPARNHINTDFVTDGP